MKKSVDDITVGGTRVLVRLDLNVPLDDHQAITDDRRIRSALPTVRKLVDGGGRLILLSHLGRPGTKPEHQHEYTLAPVAERLSELLGRNVPLVEDCVGEAPRRAVAALKDRDVCLLENLRFHQEETIKDKDAAKDGKVRDAKESFAARLAELGDIYVNDAFGTCHRDNASMLTVPRLMQGRPRVIGYLVRRELRFLGDAVRDPKRPFVCILGGAKVSDKLGFIRSLLDKCDTILVGGAMAYTFLAAEDMEVGKSRVEPDLFDTARALIGRAGERLRLPVDSVTAMEIKTGVETDVRTASIPPDRMGLDIGPETIKAYRDVIAGAKTIVWNGPMGVFETPPLEKGTLAIAAAVADATTAGAVSIIGGGDSAAAVDQAGLSERMTHISTGGGASLEFLEGKPLPAIEVLDEA